jgi:YidC/Oxa1 family membrane protein insertase
MNKKDTQRKTLAMLVLFFIAYIYVEKVLTPYFQPPIPESKKSVSDNSKAELSPDEAFSGFSEIEPSKLTSSGSESQNGEMRSVKVSPEDSLSQTARKSTPSDKEILEGGIVSIENDVLSIKISKLGGRFQSVQLKDFRRSHPNDPERYELISHVDGMSYPGGLLTRDASDSWVSYQPYLLSDSGEKRDLSSEQVSLSENLQTVTLYLEGRYPDGKEVFKKISLGKDTYLFDFSLGFSKPETVEETFFVEWSKYVESKDTSLLDPYDTDGFVWFNGDKSERLTFNDMTSEASSKSLESLKWLGFGNKYFATAFVYNPSDSEPQTTSNGKPFFPTTAKIEKKGNFARALFSSSVLDAPLSIQVFTGPKSYPMLDSIGFELKRLIDLGMTGVISAPLLSLLGLFYKFVGNYGLAIVLLTIAVKFALYPLNASQFKQMKALQALKPELDRIKEKIKDRQQQQQALMDLYKKKGVNPLGGCLPVLIQMPIFIGLYSALMLSVELRHADFGLWVHDLSAPDRLMISGIGVPVLVLLFTISMMVQQWITPTAVDPAQKKAMMIMPVVMFFMFMSFPSGLALYWLTNNLFSIGQQRAIQYHDKHGKSGFKITALVALAVFVISWLCTLV